MTYWIPSGDPVVNMNLKNWIRSARSNPTENCLEIASSWNALFRWSRSRRSRVHYIYGKTYQKGPLFSFETASRVVLRFCFKCSVGTTSLEQFQVLPNFKWCKTLLLEIENSAAPGFLMLLRPFVGPIWILKLSSVSMYAWCMGWLSTAIRSTTLKVDAGPYKLILYVSS